MDVNERFRKTEIALLASAVVFCVFWLRVVPAGAVFDDLREARFVRSAGAADIFLMRPAPAMFQLFLWKAAAAVMPQDPQIPLKAFAGVLHLFNGWLLLRWLRRFLGTGTTEFATAVFLLFRPLSEATLWAAASKEVLLTAFALLAATAWTASGEKPRRYWLAAAAFSCAMLSKPSAFLFPALLTFQTFAAEPGGAAGGTGNKNRRTEYLALAAMWVLALAGAANGVWRPGWWASGAPVETRLAEVPLNSAASFLRLILLVHPGYVLPPWAILFLGGAASGLLFYLSGAAGRIGLVWCLVWLVPQSAGSGYFASRYAYAAAPGFLLLAGALWEQAVNWRPQLRKPLFALVMVWYAASAALFGADSVRGARCGRFAQEVRELLRAKRDELLPAGRLEVANRAAGFREDEFIRYDSGEGVEVAFLPSACPPAGRKFPCLEYSRIVHTTQECPAASGEIGLRWFAAQ